jgi:glycosyltransferase involved in cell wall biosynthesis
MQYTAAESWVVPLATGQMLDYQCNSGDLRGSLAAECDLLEQSDLFDRELYRNRAGLDMTSDSAEHYLLTGWQLGIEPSDSFEGGFLHPYFCSVGLDGPPAITFLTLRAAGWPVYPNRASVEDVARSIRESEWFDPDNYIARTGCSGLDPVLHYLIVGEQIGHPPSDRFDPVYYRSRYIDVERAGMSFLVHYLRSGRAEGRRPVSVASQLAFDTSRIKPERQTVLMVLHQASRTGAPVLAYNIAMRLSECYNVVALLLAGGDLVGDFQRCCAASIGPLSYADWLPVEADYLVKRLIATYRISYAITNTIDARLMLKPLALAHVPIVALVHEFASYLTPMGEMGRSLEWATQIVFSAPSVASSAISDYPNIENRIIHILPQGQSKLPPAPTVQTGSEQQQLLRRALHPPGAEDSLVVLGCGTIFPRKGVDLFCSCAAAVAAMTPKRPVHFVWIGSPSPPHQDYAMLIREQLARSDMEGKITFLDEVADLEPAYAAAGLFLLSSRLDPLPNVAIDSMLRGIPVICFENAGGIADLLGAEPATRRSVVPHLDVHAAADLIVKLADDPNARENLGSATRRLGEKTFNMERYIQQLDKLGRDAASMMDQRSMDLATISEDPMFNTVSFLGADATAITRDGAIRLFLARSAALGIGMRPTSNFYYRRPCPGFHPQIYAHENSHHYDIATVNPLAHFIRSGKPDGPWQHQVITPSNVEVAEHSADSRLRLALHGHFFYADLFEDCLQKLKSNRTRCDLFLSTSDDAKADQLRAAAASYDRGEVMIRVVPNRGRDIGPFLTEFGKELAQGYDLVGHIHGKRSLFVSDMAVGESWREFLWQNLLGDVHPMMDIIARKFADDEGLGIVFPDDPHLSDWDYNRDIAEALAARMGIRGTLPPFFNFPIGTMFWARPKALAPLLALGLQWSDYPEEPVAIDGTVLHAVERLLPFTASHAGYRYATSHIDGITW